MLFIYNSNVTGYSVFLFYLLNLATLPKEEYYLFKKSVGPASPVSHAILPLKGLEQFALGRIPTQTAPVGTEAVFVGFGSE